jgi:hypothetical protein
MSLWDRKASSMTVARSAALGLAGSQPSRLMGATARCFPALRGRRAHPDLSATRLGRVFREFARPRCLGQRNRKSKRGKVRRRLILVRRVVLTIGAVVAIVLLQVALVFALIRASGYYIPAVFAGTAVVVGLLMRGRPYPPHERHWLRWAVGLFVFGDLALVVLLCRPAAGSSVGSGLSRVRRPAIASLLSARECVNDARRTRPSDTMQ